MAFFTPKGMLIARRVCAVVSKRHVFVCLCVVATGRPQRLAVIINPNSGKKQGCKVFTKKIQPLFRLCGVECDVYGKSLVLLWK